MNEPTPEDRARPTDNAFALIAACHAAHFAEDGLCAACVDTILSELAATRLLHRIKAECLESAENCLESALESAENEIATARAEGRREGIEAAARMAERHVSVGSTYHTPDAIVQEAIKNHLGTRIAAAIRRLAEEQS